MSNPYVITDEMVTDIVVTAFEGGSNYWIQRIEYVVTPEVKYEPFVKYGQEPFWTNGGAINVIEDEEPGTPHLLTKRVMRKGIKAAAEHYGLTPERFHEEHDAETADVALQLALLGEVVYG